MVYPTQPQTPIEKRFWKKVSKTDTCWLWTGATRTPGYGHLGIGKRSEGNVAAHRLSYVMALGEIPNGLLVCHRCDNPRCVRPDHLFLGTQHDNLKDAARKGRMVVPSLPGELNPASKLTTEQVLEIRRRYSDGGEASRQLGQIFGVNKSTIMAIVNGKKWTGIQ